MRIIKYLGDNSDYREVLINFNFTTPNVVSSNEMYGVNKGRIYKTPKAVEFQQLIIDQIQDSIVNNLKSYNIYSTLFEDLLCYEIYIGMHRNKKGWLFNNGKLRKIDLENIMKVVDDAIIRSLNIGDSELIDDSLCVGQILEKLIAEDLDTDQNVFNCCLKLYLKR